MNYNYEPMQWNAHNFKGKVGVGGGGKIYQTDLGKGLKYYGRARVE